VRRTLLFVNPWSGIIGPNVGMGQFVAEALDRGHTVHVVAPVRDQFSAGLEQVGAMLHYWPRLELTQRWKNPLSLASHLSRSWNVSSELGRLATQVGADVLCFNGENQLLAPRAGRVAGRPVAVVIRGVRFIELGALARWFFTIQRMWVTKYLAVSEVARQGLVNLGVPMERVTVVHNGVDTSVYGDGPPPPGLARSLGIPPGSRVIGAVGHLERIKGFHHLIEAFGSLAGRFPDTTCLLVGGTDDPHAAAYGDSLHARVAELGLEGRVIFTGYRKNVPDLMRLMDVVVHPSESESFGRSIAEAMAGAKAVIGFDVGAVPELIDHGETGLVVQPFDTTALAGAVERLLCDEDLRRKMGAAARERALKYYDAKRNVAAAIDFLEQMADDSRLKS
jgi:glycosyltransferase involved in cell wall biosynthesis